MKKQKIVLAVILILFLFGGCIFGKMRGLFNMGNYVLPEEAPVSGTVLEGKTILFLGSSVTYGYGSFGVSFADYFERLYGVNAVKEAVSGTTLADLGSTSYVSRLKKVGVGLRPDAFVCQLSTNDATKGIPLGVISQSMDPTDLDTSTVAGAIEFIITYVRNTWDCPIVFYTQARYDSPVYAEMVLLLQNIAEKWDVSVIDLWNDDILNDITPEQRKRYLIDAIHPTKTGYRDWWLPKMQRELSEILNQKKD